MSASSSVPLTTIEPPTCGCDPYGDVMPYSTWRAKGFGLRPGARPVAIERKRDSMTAWYCRCAVEIRAPIQAEQDAWEIESIEESIRMDPCGAIAAKMQHLYGYRKEGELSYLTLHQARTLLGIEPKPAVVEQGRVRWEYILDQAAGELGYTDGDELKRAIEDHIGLRQELAEAKRRLRKVA